MLFVNKQKIKIEIQFYNAKKRWLVSYSSLDTPTPPRRQEQLQISTQPRGSGTTPWQHGGQRQALAWAGCWTNKNSRSKIIVNQKKKKKLLI